MALPLEGIRILSMAEQLPGPYCSMLLGDLGAEVILLERPGVGDPARLVPYFLSVLGRNKKSITANLKSEKGREICLKLAQRSDVFLEGFRPGVMRRLGLDYESIRKANPKIIYCSISGYGQQGPYRDLPAHDTTYQGIAGMLSTYIERGDFPQRPTVPIADLSSAMFAVIGVLAALMARERLGMGQFVDVSMTDGLISWMSVVLGFFFNTGSATHPGGREPAYGVFQTRDNKYLTLSIAHEDHFWRNLCRALGKEELGEMPREERRQRRDELVTMLREMLRAKTRDEWLKLLSEADVPCGPVSTIEEVVVDPQVRHRGMIVEVGSVKQVAHPIKFSQTPAQIRMLPPKLGEHTEEILSSLGYSPREIEELRAGGVI